MAKRQFRFWVYLQAYKPIYFFLKNLSILLSLSLSSSKIIFLYFTISLDTLHPCQKKIPPLKLEFCRILFFPKNPSILFYLCVFL